MKAFLVLLLTCIAATAQQTHVQYADDPAKAPKRVVGNATYDARQTNLWKITTMTYVRPQVYLNGWVVMTTIDSTNSLFVLRNPPADVLQRFVQFKAQYQQTKAFHDQLQNEYQLATAAHDEAKLLVSQLKADPPAKIGSKAEMRWANDLARATDNEANLDQRCTLLGARVKTAKAQLDQLSLSGFDPNGDQFIFTAPIMRVPLKVEELPVYDRGQILPYN